MNIVETSNNLKCSFFLLINISTRSTVFDNPKKKSILKNNRFMLFGQGLSIINPNTETNITRKEK